MTFSLVWMPHVLKSAGLKVALVDGWETRGQGNMHEVLGMICHHTGDPRKGNMPSLRVLIDGRSDLAGPLCHLGLGRDGTYYVIAAGRCNHAGGGIWNGVTSGNSNCIGIEGENSGGAKDFPWPDVQLDAYQRGVAAILKFIGQPAVACCAHREYARPVGRKPDPIFNMNDFRLAVGSILDGTAPPPTLIPAAEPPKQPGGAAGRATLRRGSTGDLVKQCQRKLNVRTTGNFQTLTEAAVRELQRSRGFVPDGIVGPKTWALLDTLP